MKIPASVKVGPFVYRVEEVDDINDNHHTLGLIVYRKLAIQIRKDQPEERKFEALFHEMGHAVDDIVRLNLTEDQLNAFMDVLLAALIDNGMLKE